MKLKKLRLHCLLLCLAIGFWVAAQQKEFIHWSNVNQIEMKILDPLTISDFGRVAYNRDDFDKIFDKKADETYDSFEYVVLENRSDIMYFITIYNNLELVDSCKNNIIHNNLAHPNLSNLKNTEDPIETRGKIIITMNDGAQIIAFWSPTIIDILNYKYVALPISTIVDFYFLYSNKSSIDFIQDYYIQKNKTGR